MIFEGHHVADVALQVGQFEVGVLGQCAVAIAHTMALDVGLGYYVESVFVAQLIPTWIVGVVAGAYGVDVELLHDLDVLNHALHRYHIAMVGVELVAVSTLEVYGLTVYEHLIILEFYLAETYLLTNCLNDVAIYELDVEVVEIGSLCSPLDGIGHGQYGLGFALIVNGSSSVLHHLTRSILQSVAEALACSVVGGGRNLQCTILIVLVQVGEDEEVVHAHLGTGIHIHFTSDTGKAPEVLVFEVRAIAPTHHLHGYEVLFAGYEVGGDVKLGCHLSIFAIAHIFAVDPHHEV